MRRLSQWMFVLGVVLLAGCGTEFHTAPDTDQPATVDPAMLARAFRVEINVETGEMVVHQPGQVRQASPGGPMRSLLGGEVVGMTVSNFFRSPVGQFVKNKRTIKIDLVLTNLLSVTDLVTPTFPIPPTGVQGVLAFPYTVGAFGVAGGKATPDTTWNGTGVLPSGAPFNFFNDLGNCVAGVTSDCYRWEAFGTVLTPGTSTAAHRVGFTVDPGVTTIQVYVVVAADLLDHPPIPPVGQGAVLGVVSSPTTGLLAGISVTAAPGGVAATTDGIGKYVLVGLTAGSASVTLSSLPAGCTNPGSKNATVVAGGVTTVDFSVTCVPPNGTISGVVDSPERLDETGATVTAMVGSQSCGESATDAAGNYILSCPPGTATVSLSIMPVDCTDPGSQAVIVPAGGTVTVNFTYQCVPLYGTISGNISSPETGPIAGLSFKFFSWLYNAYSGVSTDAAGDYSVRFFSGPATLGIQTMPAGCTNPSPYPVNVPVVANVVLDLVVDCSGPVGSISGTVSSPELGGLSAVVLFLFDATGAQQIDTTDQYGAFSFARVSPGAATISFSNIPSDCAYPPTATTPPVDPGANTSVTITVDCAAALIPGPLSGTVTSPEVGDLSDVTVQLFDTHGGVAAQRTTDRTGGFSFGDLAPGTYTVGLANLPQSCVNPGQQDIAVLPSVGAVMVFSVTCG